MTPPYKKEGRVPRVVSFICHQCEMEGKRSWKGVTATSVSETGELVDQRTFNYLLAPRAQERYPAQYNEEQTFLKEMVIRHGADLMVVGANSITADRFMKYLREVASEILQGEGIEPWVAFGPTDVSQVYATSDKAKYNLKGFSSFTKQAISLARFKQSPNQV